MKKLGFITVITLFIALIIPTHTFAQNTQNFYFESFNADYYLDKNYENASTLRVNETLVSVFPGFDQNHGILRAIPETYKGHTVSLSNISVTSDAGNKYKFTTYDQNNNKVLKIGDPNEYVHGRTIYKISYNLQDVTSYYGDHDELYWDVNGDQWDQQFNSVAATFHISNQLVKSMQDKRKCYAGYYHDTNGNCSITLVSPPGETYVTASANNLLPRQTLSAVLAFKPGTFNQKSTAIKKEEQQKRIKIFASASLAGIPPVAAFIFMFRRWRQFGDDPKGRGIIIPEYEPPKGFDVLSSEFMLNQKLRNKAFSAMLIEQAVKGNLTIIEIPKSGVFGKKDYELKINGDPEKDNFPETIEGLKAIFGGGLMPGQSIKLSEIKKSNSKRTQMHEEMKKVEENLSKNLASKGYFIKDPKKVKNSYLAWATAIFAASFIPIWAGSHITATPFWALLAGLGLAALIIFLYAFIMPARTEAGVDAHDALLGLKDYVKLAEADRLKFLQSPDGAEKQSVADEFNPKTKQEKVKLFEKLLPYAMLFGLEKDWAKQFNDIYTTPPSWYQGGNWTAFNAGYLAGSLGDFNSVSSTSFASPSSSSGSGFSGGGAGGGGGGGGGGGW